MWSMDSGGMYPIHVGCVTAAAQANDLSGLDRLLKSGACPDEQDSDGRTALMWAAARGHTELMKRLLNFKADPSVNSLSNETAASISVERGNGHCLALLARASSLRKRGATRSVTRWGRDADPPGQSNELVTPQTENELSQLTREAIRAVQQQQPASQIGIAVSETQRTANGGVAQVLEAAMATHKNVEMMLSRRRSVLPPVLHSLDNPGHMLYTPPPYRAMSTTHPPMSPPHPLMSPSHPPMPPPHPPMSPPHPAISPPHPAMFAAAPQERPPIMTNHAPTTTPPLFTRWSPPKRPHSPSSHLSHNQNNLLSPASPLAGGDLSPAAPRTRNTNRALQSELTSDELTSSPNERALMRSPPRPYTSQLPAAPASFARADEPRRPLLTSAKDKADSATRMSSAAATEALRACIGACGAQLEVETDRMMETIDSANWIKS